MMPPETDDSSGAQADRTGWRRAGVVQQGRRRAGGAKADIADAKAIQANIAEEFKKYGINSELPTVVVWCGGKCERTTCNQPRVDGGSGQNWSGSSEPPEYVLMSFITY
jgi:hypothetical protein